MTATKLWLIVVGFFAILCGYLYFAGNYKQNKIYALESEKTALKNDLEKCKQESEACDDTIKQFNKAQDKASGKIEKVRTVIKTVRSGCDCWNEPLPDGVREQLRR